MLRHCAWPSRLVSYLTTALQLYLPELTVSIVPQYCHVPATTTESSGKTAVLNNGCAPVQTKSAPSSNGEGPDIVFWDFGPNDLKSPNITLQSQHYEDFVRLVFNNPRRY